MAEDSPAHASDEMGDVLEGEQRPLLNPQRSSISIKPFINILVSGSVVSLVYTAFFPGVGLQDVVITDSGMDRKVGFYGQGITYVLCGLFAVLAPFIIKKIGPRFSLALAAVLYIALFIGLAILQQWSIYLGSGISAFGMGIMFVIGPKIVTDNSSKDTLQRNQCIYWCIYMASMISGNLADYFYLGTLTKIHTHTRVVIYIVCCILVVAGTLLALLGYQRISPSHGSYQNLLCSSSIQELRPEPQPESLWDEIKDMVTVYKTTLFRRNVGYLLVVLLFNAITLSFYTMTLQTCIGNTFPERNLIALMGIVFGLVEVIGGVLFEGIAEKIGNRRITLVLYLVACTSLFLMFMMFPKDATERDVTKDDSYLTPQKWLLLLMSGLMALYDTGFNILANTFVGRLFQAECEIGYMLLNFSMSITTGFLFILSSTVSLYAVLGLQVVFVTATTLVIVSDVVDEWNI